MVKLPGDFGMGSSTLAKWIRGKIAEDEMREKAEGSRFPKHWGEPPAAQVRDMVKLPGDYGMGSSTLAKWIMEKMKEDKEAEGSRFPKHWGKPPVLQTDDIVKLPGGFGMGS